MRAIGLQWTDWVRAAAVVLASSVACAAGVAEGPHDFSTVASSALRSAGERSVTEKPGSCFYCHAPHSQQPVAALWARSAGGRTYEPYDSSTLKADVGQPTGSSRVCLSCHDGTLALAELRGALVRTASFSGGGRATAGTDLSGDHPISFVYDAELAARTSHLVDPASLPKETRLDQQGRMQCTSCHDAHKDLYGDFLVMDNRGGRLCTTCHRMPGWRKSAHATSAATDSRGGADVWPHSEFRTVAENSCGNCHRQHGAPQREWLLLRSTQNELCLTCHDGRVATKDVSAPFRSASIHPVQMTGDIHAPDEDPRFMDEHVACSDCHDPHSVRAARTTGLETMHAFGIVGGVSQSGAQLSVAKSESEVCYSCHGMISDRFPIVSRQDLLTNTRMELATSNASYHPVDGVGRNPSIQGLEPDYTASSTIACSDCHDSDQSGSGGARGPHGSAYEPILSDEYRLSDPTMESFGTYALCYRCHNRQVLLSDPTGFPHRRHVVDERTSCAVCHDAHGSRENRALVNFMVLGVAAQEVVTPAGSGRLEFDSSVRGVGRCYLTCHGVDHDPAEYPDQGMAGTVLHRRRPPR